MKKKEEPFVLVMTPLLDVLAVVLLAVFTAFIMTPKPDNQNHKPIIKIANSYYPVVMENGERRVRLAWEDPDRDSVHVYPVNMPSFARLEGAQLVFRPQRGDTGFFQTQVIADDLRGGIDSVFINLIVEKERIKALLPCRKNQEPQEVFTVFMRTEGYEIVVNPALESIIQATPGLQLQPGERLSFPTDASFSQFASEVSRFTAEQNDCIFVVGISPYQGMSAQEYERRFPLINNYFYIK
ncbi:MAG: hypothetical protein KatS3mg042_1372 [Rhodothermaceae bacterium]|nr:MAG: hypothetical protein KatS3mg042_1372 [Rhodothermaceae bacterium]